jgi:16S rRNA processing protein RimM
VRVGRVGRPHGTDGAFVVAEPTARIELLDAGRHVLVGGLELQIASRKGTSQRPILRLDGADAEALRGEPIEVPRDALALEAGEYLVDDLIGCGVVDGDRSLGAVTDVLVLPAADVLEVDGSLLVPLVGDAIRSIDTDARRIDVDSRFFADDH